MSQQESSQSDKRQKPVTQIEENLNEIHKDNLKTEIQLALEGMQFGEIKIIVRDGQVVQIERTTRNRPHKL